MIKIKRASVTAMVKPLSEVKDRRKADMVFKHLAKLAMVSYYDSHSHWRSEIYNFVSSVPKVKSTNHWPSFSHIYDALWEDNRSRFDNFLYQVEKEYPNDDIVEISFAEVTNNAELYLKWLSMELAGRGAVSRSEVCSKLISLGF
jgi:hypothetical protein